MMSHMWTKAAALVLALSLSVTGVAYAQDDAPERHKNRLAGQVTSVDVASGTFGMETLKGEEIRIQTDENTEWHSREGSVEGIEDLEPGMPVFVLARETDDGGLLASHVGVGKPGKHARLIRFAGEVTAVSLDSSTFTLLNKDGEEGTFLVNEETRFRSRGGEINELAEREPGMLAGVLAKPQDEGLPLALVVAVGDPEDRPDRPRPEVRFIGEIIGLGDGSFTAETREGEQVTVLVDENTRYMSRNGEVNGFEDLEVGMKVAVGAMRTDEGLLAKVVAAGKPHHDRPPRDRDGAPDRVPDRGPKPNDREDGASDTDS